MSIPFSFTGRNHLEITDTLQNFTKEKLEKLEHHTVRIQSIDVIFAKEHNDFIVEASVVLDGAKLFASATADDSYAAVDLLVDKLDTQARKHKEKVTSHRHRERMQDELS